MKAELEVSVQVEINWNEHVYVRLTEDGREIVREHYRRLGLPSDIAKDSVNLHLRADKDGWVEFQLWDLMNIFGPQMHMRTTKLPFEDGMMRIGKKGEGSTTITSG